MWVCSIILGTLSDMLLVKGYLSKRNIRRLFNSIGSYGPTCGLIWLAFVGCSKTMAVAALCVSVGLGGGCFSGWQVNHVDLSPNYAGTMLGFTNTLASMTGFISPLVTGVITKEVWANVWILSSCSSTFIFVGNTGELEHCLSVLCSNLRCRKYFLYHFLQSWTATLEYFLATTGKEEIKEQHFFVNC